MVRPFELFEQFLNLFEGRKSQLERLHYESLPDRAFRRRQTQPQQAIYYLFKRFAGFVGLFVHQGGDILVEGKSSSHIMMLQYKAS